MIISPTRELAAQTAEVARVACVGARVSARAVVGGEHYETQRRSLVDAVPSLISATPGRLAALCADGALSLTSVVFVALDECDRLLGPEFEGETAAALATVPRSARRSLLSHTYEGASMGLETLEWLSDHPV